MADFIYENENKREISFPLGGIGTGCIGLAGNGQLIDIEIFNRPNKGSHAEFSHFAVKTEKNGQVIDQRILNSDYLGSYMGQLNRPDFFCYGFGVDRAALTGLPHFKDSRFTGEFPIARIDFIENSFPGKISMTAFNPFIPTNDKDSSIPGAFFEFELENTAEETLDYSIAFSQANLYTKTGAVHSFFKKDNISGIHLGNNEHEKSDLNYGDLTISTDAEDTSHQLYWYRGRWFDSLTTFWKDLRNTHRIKNREYPFVENNTKKTDDVATLVAHVRVMPGQKEKVRFVLSWNTPNCSNYWNKSGCGCADGSCSEKTKPETWKNYYATVFENSMDSGLYAIRKFKELFELTSLFKDTLINSSLPRSAIEAISANLSVIKSPTCLRLEDGSLYGFEGCHCNTGCCEGSCTHVWTYAYSIPFLFPRLERSMRSLEYKYNMDEHGSMTFRLDLPLGGNRLKMRACVDGQYGTVMRVLREYMISGDLEWLRSVWPEVKKSVEYAWSEHNPDRWDYDKDGIIEGRQHHTLDVELFGWNSWLSGMYLGGLKAAARIAEILGESETSKEYMTIFESGKKILNTELFNGEYFYQKIDLKDKTILDKYAGHDPEIYDAYWNEEQNEIMYQIGEGCGIDQTLAQMHADLTGLGEIFEKTKYIKAAQSIYKNNFYKSARDLNNMCRIFCANDEGGTIICSFDANRQTPFIPITYAEEAMHGFEYSAAVQMLECGMFEEAFECVGAIRERYDGKKRNPWNEIECGSNYARSMSSYALLLACGGFKYDMSQHLFGFSPIVSKHDFSSFWSLDSGWGNVKITGDMIKVEVLYGSLSLRRLAFDFIPTSILSDGVNVDFIIKDGMIVLTERIEVNEELLLQ